MKKSVEIKIAEAKAMGAAHPETEYRVMDKKGHHAVCTGAEWVYRELVLKGYSTVFSTKEGNKNV